MAVFFKDCGTLSSLTKSIAHCKGSPMALCILIAIELALPEPSNSYLRFENVAAPPQLASTCSHKSYFWQMSATGSIGVKAPRTVVPAVTFT